MKSNDPADFEVDPSDRDSRDLDVVSDRKNSVEAHAKPRTSGVRRWFIGIIGMAALAGLAALSAMIIAYQLIDPNKRFVVASDQAAAKSIRVGLVLGAGVAPDGTPYKELQSRLDTAAEALNDGVVNTLVLSGDNRFDHYDEPQAMLNYLVDKKQIDPARLQPDYAGRSTYESCERAAKIFELEKVLLISAGSHLPRAIYLCRHFGIEAYGLASPVEANNSWRREQLARVKAILNAHVVGEPTVLGEPIPLE